MALLAAGCGGDPLDRLAEGERGRVERVFSGQELLLANGPTVRLAGVEVPGAGEPGGAEAQAALQRLLEGRDVALLYAGARRDGYDRAVAHVRTMGARRWAQGVLLDSGLARVRTEPEARGLASEMLRREALARARGRGFWRDPGWRILLPEEAQPGFRLVEGRVARAKRTRFGWRLSFVGTSRLSVEASRRAAADLDAAGAPVQELEGRLVRVRGLIRPVFNGLTLEVNHPEQIELLREERR